jgi:hypothetical protein
VKRSTCIIAFDPHRFARQKLALNSQQVLLISVSSSVFYLNRKGGISSSRFRCRRWRIFSPSILLDAKPGTVQIGAVAALEEDEESYVSYYFRTILLHDILYLTLSAVIAGISDDALPLGVSSTSDDALLPLCRRRRRARVGG